MILLQIAEPCQKWKSIAVKNNWWSLTVVVVWLRQRCRDIFWHNNANMAAAGEAEKPNQLPRQRKKRRRKYQNVETMFRIKASVFHELSISSINCSIITTTTSP